jgi:uncharacterized protein (DUF1015 family)
MRIFPFRGTRYTTANGDPGRLAAPPYDQIDDETRARLHAESLQFCQLTVPDPEARPDPAHHSADLHRGWLEAGVIARDPEAGVYPYEILTAEGGLRLGLCALVGLETPASGIVVPHEQTVSRFVEDRLHMLRTTGCDLEPILILVDDRGTFDKELASEVAGGRPLVEHRDPYGHRHRLYPAASAATYASLLADAGAVIADGNTRWQVARSRAAELGIAIGEVGAEVPQATKLAVVTSLESPGVTIDPIHRGLAATDDVRRAAGLARARRPWESSTPAGAPRSGSSATAPWQPSAPPWSPAACTTSCCHGSAWHRPPPPTARWPIAPIPTGYGRSWTPAVTLSASSCRR